MMADDDAVPTSEELRLRAMESVRAGNFSGARTTLARALRLAGDPDQSALVQLSLAYVQAELGDAAAATSACRALLDTPGLKPETTGRIWQQLALLHTRTGDMDAGVAAFSHAIPLLEADRERLGMALINRGNAHLQRHDPVSAVADLSAAAGIFSALGRAELTAKAEHNLGYAHLLVGDLVSALSRMESAAHTLAALSPVSRAVGEQDRAEVLLAAGRAEEAVAAL